MTEAYDVVIVGAGITGCAAAHALAPSHDVLVLDRAGVAAEATGLSAGVIAPSLFYGDLPRAADHAGRFFTDLDGTGRFIFTRRDRLDIITPEAAPAEAERVTARSDAGLPVQYLDAQEVERAYPEFDLAGYAGASLYRDTGWVDPHTLATTLRRLAEHDGAVFETGVEGTRITLEGDRVGGVDTDDGLREAGWVVVAAGWRTPGLLGRSGIEVTLPVRPYRTQCVIMEPDPSLSDAFPIVRLSSEHLYFRPEETGSLLVGGGSAAVDQPGRTSPTADESFIRQVGEVLPRLVPGFDDAGVSNTWAGVDTATPDGRAIIDQPPKGPAGLVVATGFNGLGVMTAPISAHLIAAIVTETPASLPSEPFALSRFDDHSPEFDLVTTSDL